MRRIAPFSGSSNEWAHATVRRLRDRSVKYWEEPMLNAMAAAGLALSVLVPQTFSDATPAPPGKIVIDVVTVNGSGCPDRTAAVAVAPDNTAFTVTYSKFTAQVGVGSTPTDFRKNCQLNLRVHVPQGFTYAIAQADYRGFAHLEKGATALERANYYF